MCRISYCVLRIEECEGGVGGFREVFYERIAYCVLRIEENGIRVGYLGRLGYGFGVQNV
jgi:hypothetical protein